MILISNEVIEVLNPSSTYLMNRTYLLQFLLCAFGTWKGLFICLLIYLLVIFILFICFICLVVIGQVSFGAVEKGLRNNLLIVLKKLNDTYSEEMTNVFSKETKSLNDVRHENIIELLAVCDNPAVIILELSKFSMKPFQGDQ